MNHLVKAWYAEANRLKKSIVVAKRANDLQAKSTYIRFQEIWLRCARELTKANRFKYDLGDTVTAIKSGYSGKVTSRTEFFSEDGIDRVVEYCVDDHIFYFEKDLK